MKTKSRRRDNAEGTIDKIAGRVLDAVGKVTGNRSTKAKGKARARPSATARQGASQAAAPRSRRALAPRSDGSER